MDLLIDIYTINNNDKKLARKIYEYINNFICNFNNDIVIKLKHLIKITNYDVNIRLSIEKIKENKCDHNLLKLLYDLGCIISYLHVKKFLNNIIETIENNIDGQGIIIIDSLFHIFIESEYNIG